MEMNMLLTNNSRKMAGLPLHRKSDKRKRYFTRCEAMETVGAFLDYVNGKYEVNRMDDIEVIRNALQREYNKAIYDYRTEICKALFNQSEYNDNLKKGVKQ